MRLLYAAVATLLLWTGAAVAQGTPTQSTVNCAATTTTLLAAGAANRFVVLQVPASAASGVWINVAGAAAVAAAPSISLPPGASTSWLVSPPGYLPVSAWNCISSSGTVAVTLIYQ